MQVRRVSPGFGIFCSLVPQVWIILLLKYTIFNHCNLKCAVIMLSNIRLWYDKIRGRKPRRIYLFHNY